MPAIPNLPRKTAAAIVLVSALSGLQAFDAGAADIDGLLDQALAGSHREARNVARD